MPTDTRGRKRPLDDNGVLTHWLNAVLQLMAAPENDGQAHHPVHKELILAAHRWGEAMVRAELELRMDACEPAWKRLNAFRHLGCQWYARGYRYYLRPRSAGAPKEIAARASANKWLAQQTDPGLRENMVDEKASRDWWKAGLHLEMFAEAQRAMEAETQRAVERQQQPLGKAPSRPPDASASTTVRRPIAGLAPSPATQSAKKRARSALRLPTLLAKLLAEPASKTKSVPRDDIAEHVASAFHNLRPMRAWEPGEKGKPTLSFLDGDTHAMQLHMSERGLDALFGGLDVDNKPALERLGLAYLNGGGYNSIWGVRRESAKLDALFPPVVVEPFRKGALVLRIPHSDCEEREPEGTPRALWLTFDEAVGEATNMLFTAVSGCGPRVAALSFARRISFEESPANEGVPTVLYKIYAWLERGTMSVDERFAANRIRTPASALSSRAYYDALLVAIARISNEGFVHCDATLRNFVDFYSPDLFQTKPCDAFAIKVIDVDASAFRRLHPRGTTDWRYLFLHNLLTVLVFLKIKLEKRWDPAAHWSRVQPMCQQLISELPGTRTVASIAVWRGAFFEEEEFPCMNVGKYAGDSPEAAAHAAMRFMKHYLLKQPLSEGRRVYISALRASPQDPEKLRAARAWYDNVYRESLAPARAFFLNEYCGNAPPKRFVQVAYEFLDTPHHALKDKHANALPPTSEHRPFYHSNEYLLGVVRR